MIKTDDEFVPNGKLNYFIKYIFLLINYCLIL